MEKTEQERYNDLVISMASDLVLNDKTEVNDNFICDNNEKLEVKVYRESIKWSGWQVETTRPL